MSNKRIKLLLNSNIAWFSFAFLLFFILCKSGRDQDFYHRLTPMPLWFRFFGDLTMYIDVPLVIAA